jgi:hypothetical protein
MFAQGTTGDWVEYDRDQVTSAIYTAAGDVDLTPIKGKAGSVRAACAQAQATATSVLSAYLQSNGDDYVTDLKTKIEKLSAPTEGTLSRTSLDRFDHSMMSRDTVAIGQGIHLAPHEVVRIQARAVESPFDAAAELGTLIGRAAEHIDRITQAPLSRARQVEPPRHVRRLRLLGRLESCQEIRGSGTRLS